MIDLRHPRGHHRRGVLSQKRLGTRPRHNGPVMATGSLALFSSECEQVIKTRPARRVDCGVLPNRCTSPMRLSIAAKINFFLLFIFSMVLVFSAAYQAVRERDLILTLIKRAEPRADRGPLLTVSTC